MGVGAENVDALRTNVKMNREKGVDVELIDHDPVATFWPTARLADFAAFAYEPHGGHGDASHRHGQRLAASASGSTNRPW